LLGKETDMTDATARTAIVTGGARGIGAAIAARLAAVAPGFVETEMTRATAQRLGIPFDDYVRQRAANIPVGRAGQPEDIAHVVSFLVSEDAGYVSGQVIYAAGGPRS
jgi:NAD(P)-dependent dehydrogenase (short-subunit alcohol dehydrogenase family)